MEGVVTGAAPRFPATPAFWRGRRVLVTGHTGFKGGWLTLWLSHLGAQVWGFALPPGESPNLFDELGLAADCTHTLGDIRDARVLARALEEAKPEIVFHLAAQPIVRRSYREPLETISTNVLGTAHVLEAVRHTSSVRASLVVTSDKVYENREQAESYREDDRLGGHDLYSVSKACAEIVASGYRRAFFSGRNEPFGLGTARAGNVIGGGDWAQDRLVPDLARAFSTGEMATVRSPGALRPWQFVVDVVRGYLMFARALFEDPLNCPTALNFGPAQASMTVAEIAQAFAQSWGEGRRWSSVEDVGAVHEAKRLAIDSRASSSYLGWSARIPVSDGLAMAAEWYRLQASGVGRDALRDISLRQIEAGAR